MDENIELSEKNKVLKEEIKDRLVITYSPKKELESISNEHFNLIKQEIKAKQFIKKLKGEGTLKSWFNEKETNITNSFTELLSTAKRKFTDRESISTEDMRKKLNNGTIEETISAEYQMLNVIDAKGDLIYGRVRQIESNFHTEYFKNSYDNLQKKIDKTLKRNKILRTMLLILPVLLVLLIGIIVLIFNIKNNNITNIGFSEITTFFRTLFFFFVDYSIYIFIVSIIYIITIILTSINGLNKKLGTIITEFYSEFVDTNVELIEEFNNYYDNLINEVSDIYIKVQ